MEEITVIKELKEQIQVVAQVRRIAQSAKDLKQKAFEDWQADNAEVLSDVVTTAEFVSTEEEKLRELTLQAYAQTGDKKPAEGVGIRELTKLEYDPKEAYQWALKHQMALGLDKTAFEKIAKADTPEFVRVYTESQATIATQL